MDTTKLTLGQEVWMQSGSYAKRGKVVAIGSYPAGAMGLPPPKWYAEGPLLLVERYVEVEFNDDDWRYRIRFDAANGRTGDGWRGLGYWYYVSILGWLQEDPRIPSTEYGPWELVDHGPTDGKERIPASL